MASICLRLISSSEVSLALTVSTLRSELAFLLLFLVYALLLILLLLTLLVLVFETD